MAGKCWPRAARRAVIASRPSKTAEGGPQGFPRAARLVRRPEFEAVYRKGARKASARFVVFYRANGGPRSRFGISVKKALGGSVQRNRIRRRIREIVRRNRLEIPPGWDIVIHPRNAMTRAEFAPMEAELAGVLRGLSR